MLTSISFSSVCQGECVCGCMRKGGGGGGGEGSTFCMSGCFFNSWFCWLMAS